MRKTVLLNGEFMTESEAHVGVDNGGWLHGGWPISCEARGGGAIHQLEKPKKTHEPIVSHSWGWN